MKCENTCSPQTGNRGGASVLCTRPCPKEAYVASECIISVNIVRARFRVCSVLKKKKKNLSSLDPPPWRQWQRKDLPPFGGENVLVSASSFAVLTKGNVISTLGIRGTEFLCADRYISHFDPRSSQMKSY